MEQFVNINNKIRVYLAKQLEQFYNESEDKEVALAQYADFIWELREEKGDAFFQIVIGLCFSDACRLLHFFDLYNKLADDMKNLLDRIDQFEILDDIEDLIEEKPYYFSMMIQAPLKYLLFPLRNQASMLLMSQKVTAHFDLFHELEMKNMFENVSLESITEDYEHQMQKRNLRSYTIDPMTVAFEKLIALSMGNPRQFYQVLHNLLCEYYKLNKIMEIVSPGNVTELARRIIVKVENCSIHDIVYSLAYDEDLMEEILIAYLSLHSLYGEEYDAIYELQVPDFVKKKIKRGLTQ